MVWTLAISLNPLLMMKCVLSFPVSFQLLNATDTYSMEENLTLCLCLYDISYSSFLNYDSCVVAHSDLPLDSSFSLVSVCG